jgi:MFS transporter, PAT family, beta-lactamase induction signal transducer AmpG
MILIAPFGATSGYVTVAVAYLLTRAGVPVVQTAALVALTYIPHTWKFLWAPIADTTLTRKRWYMIAAIVSAAGLAAIGAIPATPAGLALLSVVVVTANVGVTFLGMSVESLMAYCTPPEFKGRAGGWFQAGNLGGVGIGGGAGLWFAENLPAPWMACAIVGACCLLCALGLFFVAEPVAAHRFEGIGRSLVEVGKDLWSVARARVGLLALILCFLPIGSSAASNLWSAVADDWRASANAVALVNGVLGGVVSAIGCLAGGWICDRMNRKGAYALYGVLQGVCAVAMALAPRTEAMYIVYTLAYAFVTGLTFAGFSAFVLEAMGTGAAATKYNVFASLSNMPIYYVTRLDGWAHTRWGSGGMLYCDAAAGLVGLLLFAGVLAALPKPKPARIAVVIR